MKIVLMVYILAVILNGQVILATSLMNKVIIILI